MIFHPQLGQQVRIHYAKRSAQHMPLHGRRGTIVAIGKGFGPRNVGVVLDGSLFVIPRGNLVPEEQEIT